VIHRRTFLRWVLGVGTASVAGVLSVPLVRFALDPLTRASTKTDWSDLGPASDFEGLTAPQKRTVTITQLDGWRRVVTEKSIYVVKGADGRVAVLSAICPHLGCSVKWNDTGTQFKCPCHNGTFSPEGKLLSGPPPRNLDALESRITGGHLQIRYQSFRQLVKMQEVIA
jgi:menaquinol-cytochrome c reductase iron-sulfur subunit